jgi:hypothetical protein
VKNLITYNATARAHKEKGAQALCAPSSKTAAIATGLGALGRPRIALARPARISLMRLSACSAWTSSSASWPALGPGGVVVDVTLLFGGQRVDSDAHGAQLDLSDFLILLDRNVVNRVFQTLALLMKFNEPQL